MGLSEAAELAGGGLDPPSLGTREDQTESGGAFLVIVMPAGNGAPQAVDTEPQIGGQSTPPRKK